jgi:hypothetical protein
LIICIWFCMCLSSGAGLDKAIGCFDAAVQVCFLPSKIMYIDLCPLLYLSKKEEEGSFVLQV